MESSAYSAGTTGDHWGATTAADFCTSWLALQCLQLQEVRAGLLLLEQGSGTFVPAAVWPSAQTDVGYLAPAAEQCLGERQGKVLRGQPGALVVVAYPIELEGRFHGAVVLDLADRPDEALQRVLRQLHWGIGWIETLFLRRQNLADAESVERVNPFASDEVRGCEAVAAVRPALRAHAHIQRQRFRGQPWYVLHDSAAGKLHRFSPGAYRVVRLLDGERTIDAIWTQVAAEAGADAPTQDEVIRLRAQLHAGDLLLLFLFAVPLPLRTHAEGVVWVPENAEVRAGANGFVEHLFVSPEATVDIGEVLLAMSDPALAAQADEIRARVRQYAVQYAALMFDDRAQAAAIQEDLQRERVTLASSEEKLDALLVVGQDDIALVRERRTQVEVKLVDRLDRTYAARLLREVPGGHEQLPSKALSLAGGGPHATDPRDPDGLRTLQRLFQFDLELPPEVGTPEIGTRVFVRFHHHAEPLARQWGRRLRQIFLARFDV